jgi:hypothetical protein
MKKHTETFRSNTSLARAIWGKLPRQASDDLKRLTEELKLSVAAGHLHFLEGKWYVTHAGLLRIAQRNRCFGITTVIEKQVSEPTSKRWVFKATVFKSPRSRGFVGYGDADPSNTSSLVRGAEMRVAETRAVNRALRKAYGIGLCSVEELGSHPFLVGSPNNKHGAPQNGHRFSNGQPSLRDKLCLLIRNYELDPTLVKRYAADFCGTETLREASRDLVESFVSTIAQEAANNRAALVCKLNSYNQPEEVRP